MSVTEYAAKFVEHYLLSVW